MKKYYIAILNLIILNIFSLVSLQAQAEVEETDKPVKATFETSVLIDQQTSITPFKGGLDYLIQHRFSEIKSIDDLFGVYGNANTRMSLLYGFTDKISFGIGYNRTPKVLDLNGKYRILTQTRSGSVPVSIAYFLNAGLNFNPREFDFEDENLDYKFIHRLSYFHQLIIARRFNRFVSLQLSPMIAHHNTVYYKKENINLAVSLGGRVKASEKFSGIFEYTQPITLAGTYKPNASLGFEIGTATHAFQLFVASYNSILPQYNVIEDYKKPYKNYLRVGMNIMVRF